MPGITSALALIVLLLLLVPAPLGTDRRVRRFPVVTASLISINSLILLLSSFSVSAHSAIEATSFYHWGLVPSSPRLLAFVTHLFIHVGVSHLVWNMLFLWLFGPHVEDALGRSIYLALYLVGGAAAGLLHVAIVLIFAPHSEAAVTPLFGASGAISAVLGLFAVRYFRSRIRVYWVPAGLLDKRGGVFEAPAIVALGLWMTENVVLAIAGLFHPDHSGIAYWAHIGGFIFGVVVAQLMDLFGDGAKDYLVHEARNASKRGTDSGIAEAARKYRLALQRRPSDDESRKALALLPTTFPTHAEVAREAVRDQYSDLIAYFVLNQSPEVAQMWVDEAMAGGYSPRISPAALLGLGQHYGRIGLADKATQIYERLIERHPKRQEAARAYLELAQLQLRRSSKPAEAIGTLRAFLHRPGADIPHA